MSRILCLDVGEKHTGVALTDPTRTIAQGLCTVHHQTVEQLLARVADLVREYTPERVVVGLPLGSAGRPTLRSQAVQSIARRLRKVVGVPVVLFDERHTTARANVILEQTYGRPQRRRRPPATGRSPKRRRAVDRIAAAIILEDYLATTSE